MSTVEVTRRGPRAAIRLRRAPHHEPPFDDERDPRSWPSPDQLALDWSDLVGGATPKKPPEQPPPVRRTVVEGVSGDGKLAVRRFMSTCIEVLNGYRPPAHLRSLSQPREAGTVVAQGLAGARRVAEARRAATAGRTARTRRPTPAAIVRIHLCEPRRGAVEAAAVLMIGDRAWAMTLRLELHDDTWQATTLRLI